MTRIYISSTFSDLKDCREVVYDTLRKLRHDVIAMEDYVAKDQRPLDKCLDDVAACDIYVGIFAWRYGFIPQNENPDKKSITELEYRQATKLGKERLLFLLHKDALWPRSQMDEGEESKQIEALRAELSSGDESLLVSFFHNHEELARMVSVAVSLAESTARRKNYMLPEMLKDASRLTLGSTLLPEIVTQIGLAISDSEMAEVVEVDLGAGKSWWSTRLYLLAALGDDFTKIKQLVFVREGRFIGIASPAATRRALAAVHPDIDMAYQNAARVDPNIVFQDRQERVVSVVQSFGLTAQQSLGDPTNWEEAPKWEEKVKIWMTQDLLEKWLGKELLTDSVTVPFKSTDHPTDPLLLYQIVNCRSPFVALVQDQKLVGVIDRVELSVRIASSVLARELKGPPL
jgi:hypothetical protein